MHNQYQKQKAYLSSRPQRGLARRLQGRPDSIYEDWCSCWTDFEQVLIYWIRYGRATIACIRDTLKHGWNFEGSSVLRSREPRDEGIVHEEDCTDGVDWGCSAIRFPNWKLESVRNHGWGRPCLLTRWNASKCGTYPSSKSNGQKLAETNRWRCALKAITATGVWESSVRRHDERNRETRKCRACEKGGIEKIRRRNW